MAARIPIGTLAQKIHDHDRVWTIKHASGLPHEVYVVIRGHITHERNGPITLPAVELEKVPFRSQWLAWKDMWGKIALG